MATERDSGNVSAIGETIQKVAEEFDAEIYVYAGIIHEASDYAFINDCSSPPARPNGLLLLTTSGGSIDAAYRIIRWLQEWHEEGEIIIFVDTVCKSAGTLMALGAHRIVMSDYAELGPLDVQLAQPDELWSFQSGLVVRQALDTLGEESFKLFEQNFLKLLNRSGFQITTRTATELALDMVVSLFAPIYEQIDPMRLGEIYRSMQIAEMYAERVSTINVRPGAAEQLISGYASHAFVIDRRESRNLFDSVDAPSESLARLVEYLEPALQMSVESSRPLIRHLTGMAIEESINGENSDGGEPDEFTEIPRETDRKAEPDRPANSPGDSEIPSGT